MNASHGLEFAQTEVARASLDHCVKCTICETHCPVSAVTGSRPLQASLVNVPASQTTTERPASERM